jgi:putative chitinase
LTSLFQRLPASDAHRFVEPLNLYLARYSIDSIARMASFFGQVGVESAGLTRVDENLRYSNPGRLVDVFGARVFEGVDASTYANDPERLANRVYGRKGGNGDEDSGDGWRYRGRGLIQLTLKDNYAAFSRHCGVDLLADPDLLFQPSYAVWAACWFWHENRLNALADTENLDELTRRINRARHALAERKALTRRARDELRLIANEVSMFG